MKIVVTGSCGLVGSNFCEYVLANHKECEIFGIDDLSGGYIDNLEESDKLKFYKLDLTDACDQKTIESEIFEKHRIEYIYHFSAYAAEGLSSFIRQYNYTSNIIPTVFLINMGIKYDIRRFVFTSSMATYGVNKVPYTEDLPLSPIDSYGIAKYACEMDLRVAFEQHGMEYCILKPHNIYGKKQNIWDPYRNVLGIWMYKILNNQDITIYGDGNQERAFSYIDDILPCIWNAALSVKARNEIVNLGGMHHITLNEAADIMMEVTGCPVNSIVHLEPRHEVKYAWSSYEKSVDVLNYVENTTFKDGLRKMWEWVKLQPQRDVRYWDEYELEKNVYSYWKIDVNLKK